MSTNTLTTTFQPRRPLIADSTEFFSAEEIAKARAYHKPLSTVSLIETLMVPVAILLLGVLKVLPWSIDRLGITSWPLQMALVVLVLQLVFTVMNLPLSYWQIFVHEKKWGFNTSTVGTFVVDNLKSFPVGFVVIYALFTPLWWVIRSTELWWLYGTVVFVVFQIVFTFLFPLVFIPMFNKLVPLERDSLRDRLNATAQRAGAKVGSYLVMDAGKRTKHDNAMVTGLGKSRRVVMFDNLLELKDEEIEVVVAHELGHWRRHHLPKQVVVGAISSLVLLGLVKLVAGWPLMLHLFGVNSIREPAALLVLVFAGAVAQLVTKFASSWVSRWFEREADYDALELTRSPESFRSLWRSMAVRNLSDLDPSWFTRATASHPPVAQRIAFASVWEQMDTGKR